jgi:hypothetical protein
MEPDIHSVAFARRNFEKMTKILLILWTLGPTGEIDRLEIDGWFNLERCNAAAVSLTESNPADGWAPKHVARCVEVPR